MDLHAVQWMALVLAPVVLVGAAFWLVAWTPKARLMRCPEAGAVVFVEVQAPGNGGREDTECAVRQCELWPERATCTRGCLARYWETSPGFRVNLDSLRPFDQQ